MVQKYELCSEKVYAKLMLAAEGEEEDLVLVASADILKPFVGARRVLISLTARKAMAMMFLMAAR